VGFFYFESSRLSSKIEYLIEELVVSGNGSIKIDISDGTSTVSKEYVNLTNSISNLISDKIDCSSLLDNTIYTIKAYLKNTTSNITSITRFYLYTTLTAKSNYPILINNTLDNSTDSKAYYLLDSSRYISHSYLGDNTTALDVIIQCDITSGSSGSFKIVMEGKDDENLSDSKEVITNVNTSGIIKVRVPHISVPDPTPRIKIYGRITSSSGILNLKHYEVIGVF